MKYNQIVSAIVIVNVTGILTGIAQLSSDHEPSLPIDQLQLMVIISPQYGNDKDILGAVQNYLFSVDDDLGWKGKIIALKADENNYQKIDNIIELYYNIYKVKACILVGEDIDTPLAGTYNDFVKPSTVPWSTIGGFESYDLSYDMVVSRLYKINICISLVYPTFDTKFEEKKNQIISAFHKFTFNRNIKYDNKTLIFESSDINIKSKSTYQSLDYFTDLKYFENPVENLIKESYNQNYSMFAVHGHSSPAGTCINSINSYWFKPDYIKSIKSPIFAADGCYTNGWQINDNSNYKTQLFNSDNLQVMFLGLLTQNNDYFQTNFIENTMPELFKGGTVAESMIGDFWLGDVVIYGDPTFHF